MTVRDTGKEEADTMRRRDCRVTLYLSRQEKDELRRKARAACMDDNTYLRELLRGHEPRQAPDERFWSAMGLIREFADKVDEIAMNSNDPEVIKYFMHEAKKWRMFQNAIEMQLLRPKGSDGNGSD